MFRSQSKALLKMRLKYILLLLLLTLVRQILTAGVESLTEIDPNRNRKTNLKIALLCIVSELSR